MPNADTLLRELRSLYHASEAGAFDTALFLQKFHQLDELLSDSGQFPIDWVTKLDQERNVHKPSVRASNICGHPVSLNGCVNPDCERYSGQTA